MTFDIKYMQIVVYKIIMEILNDILMTYNNMEMT